MTLPNKYNELVNNINNRRKFLIQSSKVAAFSLVSPYLSGDKEKAERRFRICLNAGAIGVALDYERLLGAAKYYEFEAVVPPINECYAWSNQKTVLELDRLQQLGLQWGVPNLPIAFRQSHAQFEKDFKRLKTHLHRLEAANIKALSTWVMPTHASLKYDENMKLHVSRLQQVAQLLADANIKLGLEYVGPKTLRESQQYPFISSLREVKELIDRIGQSNVGVQLDAFHWYCAGESKADILSLKAEDIITVDLNDAVKARTREEQLDWERELPGATGVVDLKSFLEALVEIGYDGPVRAEPFNEKLNKLENQEALEQTSKALHKAVKLLD